MLKKINSIKYPDSIMDNEISQQLRLLCKEIEPKILINALTDSYNGYGLMANALFDWLILIGIDLKDIIKKINNEINTIILKSFDPSKMDPLFDQNTLMSSTNWLNELLSDSYWKGKIFDISKKYPNSIIYKHLKLENSNFKNKNNNVLYNIQNLNTFDFQDFLIKFKAYIIRLIKHPPKTSITNTLKYQDFISLICDQKYAFIFFTYFVFVYAIDLNCKNYLHSLYKYLCEYIIRMNLSNELELQEIKICVIFHNNDKLREVFLEIFHTKQLTSNNINTLYTSYHSNSLLNTVLLHSDTCFNLFISYLFSKDSNNQYLNQDSIEKLIYLLAFSSIHSDNIDSSHINKNNKHFSRELQNTINSIKSVSQICTHKEFGVLLVSNYTKLIIDIKSPIIAHIILFVCQSYLTDFTYYNTSYQSSCNNIFFYLIFLIIENHIELKDNCFYILKQVFVQELPSSYSAISTIKLYSGLMKVFLSLIHHDFFEPVFNLIIERIEKIDYSLIRTLILDIIKSISGPYSTHFLNEFLELIFNNYAQNAVNFDSDSIKIIYKFLCVLYEYKERYMDISKSNWKNIEDYLENKQDVI